jgi:MoxR-like ATPase
LDEEVFVKIRALIENVEKVIYGKTEAVQLAVVAFLARGHLLIEDVPGVGKTTLAFSLARSTGCTFHRIQFTSDLLPSDIIGVTVFNPERREFQFKRGAIFSNIILADEINRTTPKTQSALLEAMNESRVSVDGTTHILPDPFFVLATQNPLEHHGTFPLPDSQLDRFRMRIRIGYPDARFESDMIKNQKIIHPMDMLKPVLNLDDILEIQRAARMIKVDEALLEYIVSIVNETRNSPHIHVGVSPRGSLSLFRTSQAYALVHGRDYVVPDDIKTLVAFVLAHRIILKGPYYPGHSRRVEAETAIMEVLEKVPVPL